MIWALHEKKVAIERSKNKKKTPELKANNGERRDQLNFRSDLHTSTNKKLCLS